MKPYSVFFRAVSFALSVIFTSNTAVWAAPAQEAAASSAPAFDLEIPAEWGTLEETYTPRQTVPGTPFIIHIRDAHAQPEAQLHIERILQFLSSEKKIGAVAVEAGFGKTDASVLNLFSDSDANEAAARGLLEMGELSGAAYFAANAGDKATVYGVEDEALYTESLKIFKKLKLAKDKVEPLIKTYRTALEENEARIFSEELKNYVIKKRAWENQHDLSADYFLLLNTLAEKYLDFSFADAAHQDRWPYLVRLIKTGELERGLDIEAARKESAELCEKLTAAKIADADYLISGIKALAESREPFERWMERNPYQGSSSARHFFELLWRSARERGISIVAYPQFLKLGGLAVLRQEILPDLLFKEIASVEEMIEKKIVVSGEEKKLFELSENINLVSKLLRLQMSREDHAAFMAKKESLSPSNLKKEFSDLSFKTPLKAFSASLLKEAETFYVLSVKRDQALIDNTLRFAGSKPAVLIAGGFHSEGLTQILKSKNIPFVSILPKMTRVADESLYENAMLGTDSNLKTLFSGSSALGVLELINRPETYSRIAGNEKQRDLLLRALLTFGVNALLEKGLTPAQVYADVRQAVSSHPEIFGNGVTWHRDVPIQAATGKKSADIIRVQTGANSFETFVITSSGLAEAKPAIRLSDVSSAEAVNRSEVRSMSRRSFAIITGAVFLTGGAVWVGYELLKFGQKTTGGQNAALGRQRYFEVNVPEYFWPNYINLATYTADEIKGAQDAVIAQIEAELGAKFSVLNTAHIIKLAEFYKLTQVINEADGFTPEIKAQDAVWWVGFARERNLTPQGLAETFFWRWQVREIVYHYGTSLRSQGDISAFAERSQLMLNAHSAIYEQQRRSTRNRENPPVPKRSEARIAANPVSIHNLPPAERLASLLGFYSQVQQEKAAEGSGNLINVIAISDPHADISRFLPLILEPIRRALPDVTIPEDFKYDRMKPFFDQLEQYGVTPEMLEGKVFYHNLGDIPDRGGDALEVGNLSEDLIESGLSDFIIGNHDLWAFLNLYGFHLPWYEGFKFYGYSDPYDKADLGLSVDKLVRDAHAKKSETFGEGAKTWWAKRLAEYIAYYGKLQKDKWNTKYEERVNGDVDPADAAKRVPGTGLHSLVEALFKADKALPKDQQKYKKFRELWNQFRGRNISDTEIYTGVRAVGTVSVQWWRDLLKSFNTLKNDPALNSQPGLREAWDKAIAMINDEILPEVTVLLDEKLKEKTEEDQDGKWWWRVFEAINYKNYTSVEWWARDWSSHKDWGTAVLDNVNRGVADAALKLTQANYLENPELQRLGKFFRKNFNLYIRDKYQNVYLHAFLPVDSNTGEFYFTYRNVEYRGKGNAEKGIPSVWEGLNKIGEDVRNPGLSPLDLYEALNLVNSWYADNTTIAKATHVISAFKKFGVKGLGEINGYSRLFNGHIPAADYLKQAVDGQPSFITGFNTDSAFFNTDQGAAAKFGGRGGFGVIGAAGIFLVGYTHKGSKQITDNPRTLSDDGTKTLFENKGVPRDEFLATLTVDLQNAVFELASLPVLPLPGGTVWTPEKFESDGEKRLSIVVPANVLAKLPPEKQTDSLQVKEAVQTALAQAGYLPQDYEISPVEIKAGETSYKITFNDLKVKTVVAPAPRNEVRFAPVPEAFTGQTAAQPKDTGISTRGGQEFLINEGLDRTLPGRRIPSVLGVSGRVTQKVLAVSDLEVPGLWAYAENVFGFGEAEDNAVTPDFSAAFSDGSSSQAALSPQAGVAPRIVVLLGDTTLTEADLNSMRLTPGSRVIVVDKPGEDTSLWNRYAHLRLGASRAIMPKRVSLNEAEVYDYLQGLFKKFPQSVPVLVLPPGTPHDVLGAYGNTAAQDGFVVASPRRAEARLALSALTGRVKPTLLREQVPDDLVAFKFYSNALSPVSIQPGAEGRFAKWAFAAAMQQRFAASA